MVRTRIGPLHSPSLTSCNCTWRAIQMRLFAGAPWPAPASMGAVWQNFDSGTWSWSDFGPVALEVPTMTVSTSGGAQVDPAEVQQFHGKCHPRRVLRFRHQELNRGLRRITPYMCGSKTLYFQHESTQIDGYWLQEQGKCSVQARSRTNAHIIRARAGQSVPEPEESASLEHVCRDRRLGTGSPQAPFGSGRRILTAYGALREHGGGSL